MPLTSPEGIINQLSPPCERSLVIALVDEFVSMERRFIQRDWGVAELDGGQFCEILARIIYHQDSGNLDLKRSFDDCLRYINNDQTNHTIIPRHDAIHLAQALKTIYKFRSQRGAVHISPTYQPNHMDAKLVVECARWAMNETLRIFCTGNRDSVAKTIRELLQFDIPCIGSFENVLLVQRTDLKAEEEVLLLLHYAGEAGFRRNELETHAKCSSRSVGRALEKLTAPETREVVMLAAGAYRLTDLGARRIREQLSAKLLIA